MSTHILYEFYHGNLSPADRQMIKGTVIARAMNKLSRAKTILERTFYESLPNKRRYDSISLVNLIT